ncbi:MAG: LysE family translocator, partial [Aliarcobacter sp.]|nr:LysE family translocator [Aliarcobacter sp.]
IGLSIGAVFFTLLAIFGLYALFETVPFLYGIFKLFGGVYLLYLAYKIWKHSGESLSMDMKLEKSSKGFFKAMLFGFITQISNPKTAIIIGSIFAALLPKELPAYSELLLCLIAFSIDAIWYSMVVVLLSTKKSQKIYLQFKKYIDRVAGTLLAALGIKIALDY